jgi:uncharacterized protein YciI
MSFFVVINEQGPAWVAGRSMRDQQLWTEHAAWVNALVGNGFIVAAGPIGDGAVHRAMLIVQAESEAAIRSRFAEDPWIRVGVLHILKIDAWTILASDDRLDKVLAEITRGNL